MKAINKRTALVALGALLATATLAFAAEKSDKEAKPEGPRPEAVGPEAECQGHPMFAGLELTDEQKGKLKEIFKSGREAEEVLRAQAKADTAELRLLVAKKADEAELKKAMAKVKKSREAMREAMEERLAKMDKVLTVTQQAKMMARFGEGPMAGREGGMRPGRHGEGPMGMAPMMQDKDEEEDVK